MNKLRYEELNIEDDYIVFDKDNVKVIFSTAEKGRSFNRHTEEGVKELRGLVNEFNVKDVVYLRQVHSDKIVKYDGSNLKDVIEEEADAIVTGENNTIIGVFTADCVPVIVFDNKLKVSAAIHSGWKGTYKSITKKTIQYLKKEYNSKSEDIQVIIGPHIRQCCYEVSEDLKEKFINEKNINKDILFNNRNLSLEECILKDIRDESISEENIYSIDLCTYCSEKVKLHSYRKSNGDYGRLFSFVINK